MNPEEAIKWINSFERFGIKLGLERISHIVKKLDNPHKNYKSIHVAGTNGKGSVCKFLASILTESGYKVGVYTSPHIQRFSERITVDNKEIPDEKIVSLVEKIKPIVYEMVENDNTPTFFEIVTAMAFEYFNDEIVDFAVVEVGLGGLYDATNIIEPTVSIITNISLEHTDVLGNTKEEIALQKAGIIKDGVSVITGAEADSLKVIKNVSKEKKASLNVVNEKMWKRTSSGLNGQEFHVKGALVDYDVKTLMLGKHQGENITIAISTIECLQMKGVYITERSIIDGIAKASNPGRLEIIQNDPIVLLDGAHNPAGMKVLKESLKDFEYDKIILVLGILSDKDINSMLSIILPCADTVVLTKSHSIRASEPNKLKEILEKIGYKKNIIVKDLISDAIKYAKSIAKKDDLICVTGSLFTVGEAKDFLQKC